MAAKSYPVACTGRGSSEVRRKSKRKSPRTSVVLALLDIPDDLILDVLQNALDSKTLLSACAVCVRLKHLSKHLEVQWQRLFEEAFNGGTAATVLQYRAAAIAGSWQQYMKAKTIVNRQMAAAAPPGEIPWEEPCEFERQVALQGLVSAAPRSAKGLGMFVMFLLDGSGSVTEDDFSTMKAFVSSALASISTTHPKAKVGIIQFSNEVQVELVPQTLDQPATDKQLETMVRMNGGTNIALAIQKAGQLLKDADAELLTMWSSPQIVTSSMGQSPAATAAHLQTSRVLVLLTDGRVDAYQTHEAMDITERLVDEQANVSLHAFGVGRGVDKKELLKIVAAGGGQATAEERFLGLRVLDEAPW